MKYGLTILLFFSSLICFSQKETAIQKLVIQLEEALLKKDSIALDKLLHSKVQYGHSNGWVQTKSDMFSDFRTGKLNYLKLESNNFKEEGKGKYKILTYKTHAEGSVNENNFSMNLHIMQVWIKQKSSWKLFARQSAKLAD